MQSQYDINWPELIVYPKSISILNKTQYILFGYTINSGMLQSLVAKQKRCTIFVSRQFRNVEGRIHFLKSYKNSYTYDCVNLRIVLHNVVVASVFLWFLWFFRIVSVYTTSTFYRCGVHWNVKNNWLYLSLCFNQWSKCGLFGIRTRKHLILLLGLVRQSTWKYTSKFFVINVASHFLPWVSKLQECHSYRLG